MRILAAIAPIFVLALTALSPIIASPPANAQGAIMPNYIYDLSVVRPDTSKDGDFIIRLTSPAAMTGCFKSKPADVKIIDAGPILYITIKEGSIELDKKPGCKMNAGAQFIDIPLNKNALIENNTNKIEIKSGSVGKLFDIKVEAQDNKVTLHSELKTGANIGADKTHKVINHWFYPDNTVVITANNMDKNPSIAKQVKTLAASRGLMQLDFILDGYQSDGKNLYYVDTKNIMGDTLKAGETITLGHITTTQTFQGANGPYEKPTKHAVFAKRPNAAE